MYVARLRVLTWNLKHGRAQPPAGRDLFDDFADALARWSWDIALLQEVPPWWPPSLGASLQAQEGMVLTSRNALLPLRRAIATRWPDVIKSNGGGCNAILVRGSAGAIIDHRTRCLRRFPERRWLQAIRLTGSEVWIGNLHTGGSEREAQSAAAAMLEWAAGAGCLLGGDFNLPAPVLPGFERLGGQASDHVLARGLAADGTVEVLDAGRLSDHAPVLLRTRPA